VVARLETERQGETQKPKGNAKPQDNRAKARETLKG